MTTSCRIEHEDLALPPLEGIVQSVALLRRVIAAR